MADLKTIRLEQIEELRQELQGLAANPALKAGVENALKNLDSLSANVDTPSYGDEFTAARQTLKEIKTQNTGTTPEPDSEEALRQKYGNPGGNTGTTAEPIAEEPEVSTQEADTTQQQSANTQPETGPAAQEPTQKVGYKEYIKNVINDVFKSEKSDKKNKEPKEDGPDLKAARVASSETVGLQGELNKDNSFAVKDFTDRMKPVLGRDTRKKNVTTAWKTLAAVGAIAAAVAIAGSGWGTVAMFAYYGLGIRAVAKILGRGINFKDNMRLVNRVEKRTRKTEYDVKGQSHAQNQGRSANQQQNGLQSGNNGQSNQQKPPGKKADEKPKYKEYEPRKGVTAESAQRDYGAANAGYDHAQAMHDKLKKQNPNDPRLPDLAANADYKKAHASYLHQAGWPGQSTAYNDYKAAKQIEKNHQEQMQKLQDLQDQLNGKNDQTEPGVESDVNQSQAFEAVNPSTDANDGLDLSAVQVGETRPLGAVTAMDASDVKETIAEERKRYVENSQKKNAIVRQGIVKIGAAALITGLGAAILPTLTPESWDIHNIAQGVQDTLTSGATKLSYMFGGASAGPIGKAIIQGIPLAGLMYAGVKLMSQKTSQKIANVFAGPDKKALTALAAFETQVDMVQARDEHALGDSLLQKEGFAKKVLPEAFAAVKESRDVGDVILDRAYKLVNPKP